MLYKNFKNIQLSTLGLGNMRFITLDPKDEKSPIDYSKAHEIIDRAYENGITYYDTAYVYNYGDSEKCVGECMKKYPRDSFYIATKFNYMANPDYKAVFEEQLHRLQTNHIDFYLLHCLMDNNIDNYLECGCIDYFMDLKKQGKITYLGFSSHASPEVLERFADAHDWDFAQLQLNYYDWVFGTAEEQYNILASRNIPIMVMEPVRGGRLASLTPETDAKLKEAHPDWSISSWAMRFVKSLPAVQVVLSGMNSLEQMEDNTATFSHDETLSTEDRELLMEVVKEFRSQISVPCTACRYCCEGCPKQINIPEYMKYYNQYRVNGIWGLEGINQVSTTGLPADCISCGSCMKHCPQNIQIPETLHALAEAMKK